MNNVENMKMQESTLKQQHVQMQAYWKQIAVEISEINPETEDFKTQILPLSRIKKVMKLEDTIFEEKLMISGEVPVIFAKACEIFILELSLRSWVHSEEAKRRTLMRGDIAKALSTSEMYDFLIDIVPRDSTYINTNGNTNVMMSSAVLDTHTNNNNSNLLHSVNHMTVSESVSVVQSSAVTNRDEEGIHTHTHTETLPVDVDEVGVDMSVPVDTVETQEAYCYPNTHTNSNTNTTTTTMLSVPSKAVPGMYSTMQYAGTGTFPRSAMGLSGPAMGPPGQGQSQGQRHTWLESEGGYHQQQQQQQQQQQLHTSHHSYGNNNNHNNNHNHNHYNNNIIDSTSTGYLSDRSGGGLSSAVNRDSVGMTMAMLPPMSQSTSQSMSMPMSMSMSMPLYQYQPMSQYQLQSLSQPQFLPQSHFRGEAVSPRTGPSSSSSSSSSSTSMYSYRPSSSSSSIGSGDRAIGQGRDARIGSEYIPDNWSEHRPKRAAPEDQTTTAECTTTSSEKHRRTGDEAQYPGSGLSDTQTSSHITNR